MTEGKKIETLRTLIGDTGRREDTGVLSVYLDMAGAKILERMYPYKESWDGLEVPEKYHMLQLKIATYMLQKRGAEGQVQHIENGIHRNYGDADIPDSMLASVAPFIGIPK